MNFGCICVVSNLVFFLWGRGGARGRSLEGGGKGGQGGRVLVRGGVGHGSIFPYWVLNLCKERDSVTRLVGD